MTEVAWFEGATDARLTWDNNNTVGYLSFIDPNGELAVVPVTAGDSDAATAERATNVWHIDVAPGVVEGPATVSPSIHFVDQWHSPNPVTFNLVAELAGETPSTPVVEPTFEATPDDNAAAAAPDAPPAPDVPPAPASVPVNVDAAAPPVEAPPTQEPAPVDAATAPAEPEPAPAPASPGEGPGTAAAGAEATTAAPAPAHADTTDVAEADTAAGAPTVGATVEVPPQQVQVTLNTSSHSQTLTCWTTEIDELAEAMRDAIDELHKIRS